MLTFGVNGPQRPAYTYRLCLRLRVRHGLHQIYIACMVMDRMGCEPNLTVKRSVSIGTMLNFDGDNGGTCKQALTVWYCRNATVGERGATADHLGKPRGR